MSKVSLYLLPASVVIIVSLLFSGCLPKRELTNNPNQGATTVEKKEKVGDTTLTGKITKVGDKYFITVGSKPPAEIDSYSVKLDDYVGKTATVTGQYSGDTLFVGKIE